MRVVVTLAVVATLFAHADSARAAVDTATCPNPAPVDNHLDPTIPSVFAIVRSGVDLFAVAARIAHAYAIQPRVLPARLAGQPPGRDPVTPSQDDKLRRPCTPSIHYRQKSVRGCSRSRASRE
jgi:hypothetical protein